jgi:hypothetical protein
MVLALAEHDEIKTCGGMARILMGPCGKQRARRVFHGNSCTMSHAALKAKHRQHSIKPIGPCDITIIGLQVAADKVTLTLERRLLRFSLIKQSGLA